MDAIVERETLAHERTMRSLSDRSNAPLTHVRALFRLELARLAEGATVRSYLQLLTAANVRAMLRCAPAGQHDAARLTVLDGWDDDGGRISDSVAH